MYDLVEDGDVLFITMEDSMEQIMLNLWYSKRNCVFVYDEEDEISIKFITKFNERYPNRYSFIPSTEIKDIPINWITDELTDVEKEIAKPLIDYCNNLNDSLFSFHYDNIPDAKINNKIYDILRKKGISYLDQTVYVIYGENSVKMEEVYYKIMLWYVPDIINSIHIGDISTIR